MEREPATEPRPHLRDVPVARLREVRTQLQVPRILGRLSTDETGLGRADGVTIVLASRVPSHVLAHRLREGIVDRHVLDEALRIVPRERLKIGAEEPRTRHVFLGLSVEAGMDRIVRTLEEPELAVLRQFEAGVTVILAGEADQPTREYDHGGRDVVLHLHLVGRDKVLPQLVRAPCAILFTANAEVAGDEPSTLVLELVPGRAVDDVNAESAAPIVAPLRPIEALDHEHAAPEHSSGCSRATRCIRV